MTILGVKISNFTKKETLQKVESFLFDGGQHHIVTPNPEMIVLAQRDEEFKKILNEADLAVADGAGLIFASRILGDVKTSDVQNVRHPMFQGHRMSVQNQRTPDVDTLLKEKISGIDLAIDILEMAERHLFRVYFLGGFPKVAAEMSLKLKGRFPELKIAGASDGGKIDSDGAGESDSETLKIINEAKPDILFVAFGHGKQEKWIARNFKKMPSVKIAIGIGGAFDFLSGRIKRAPNILRRLSLEWLWRLILEPKRFKRIYNATIVFPFLVFKNRLMRNE